MKQKITLLIIAICMATVAVPQTLTSKVTLVSQKTEKVFGFENEMVVIKTRITKTFEYQRSMPDSGYELIGAGDADLLPLCDVRVYEKIDASFPVKNMGLISHYDTSDYAKAFANPEEAFYSAKQDTAKVLKNYFLTKEITIKKYGISFDGNVFILGFDESMQQESIVLQIVLVWLIPCLMFLVLVTAILIVGRTDGVFLKFFSPSNPNKNRGLLTFIFWFLALAFTAVSGIFILMLFDQGFEIDNHWSIRWLVAIARIIFAYYSIRFVNYMFIKIAGRMEAKMNSNKPLTAK